ncbi:hypothetical protein [Alicyclobacillus acidoterrestris]|uniref:Uncharacterized protein n=1 Tax=Alicyclobacillus acidoterrestris (strain ATCC 49025 / DSM 3922 / CIP 106132 / NCIMB 13137 / GD3B) TaxID=1356854 RepID=T0CVB6_ALIAG|nr:hypothetical protein [Alicyclobacillus acidoterrestris]EPZ43337.1 hypothetical protein N007_12990 [Alicyclobacillus acidoterrestris ATCC 49025]UNO48773.1 hypothetical protein K1I37_19370 [Alicyclobacillus acidoterrestris]
MLSEHPEIQIKDAIHHYNMDVFNRCEVNGAVLLTLDGWEDVHPSLVTIPVDWAYAIPYGAQYFAESSNNVQRFLKACQEADIHVP